MLTRLNYAPQINGLSASALSSLTPSPSAAPADTTPARVALDCAGDGTMKGLDGCLPS